MLKSKRHFLNWIKKNSKLLPIKEKWYILNWLKANNKFNKEYQRVEYIESTGTQYINTNYTPNQNTKAYTKFICNKLNSGLYSSSNKFTAYISNRGNWRFGSATVIISWLSGVLYTSVQDKTGVIINGTNVYNYGTVTDFTSTATLRLMFNTDGFNGKIYEFKLYENDILVRNFIPCYRKSDGEIGLYDKVNNKFYTNAGTGEFIKGGNK